jgi:hypothetical protein
MAQANSNHSITAPVDTTRRRFLSQAAGVATGGAVLGMALPMPVPAAALERVPDPIAEVIEAHKAARATWIAAVYRHSDLEQELPRDLRRSHADVWEEKIVETDDPRWIECERDVIRTMYLESDAACELVGVRPTTMKGVMALLEYALVTDTDGAAWPTDLESDDGTKTRSWHYFLIENLSDAIAGLAAGGTV